MSELAKRVLFAVPAAAIFLFITWLGGFYFTGLMIAIVLFIQREMSMISEKAGFGPDSYFPYTIGLWIMLIPQLPHAFALGMAIFLIFIAFQVLKSGDIAVKELVSTLFCGVYAPLGILGLLLIRNAGSSEIGLVLTVSLLLMVWGNDVFAYFGGKAFGKRKLAPKVSPNKTWEGFLFGILGAFVGLFLVIYFAPVELPMSVLAIAPAPIVVSIFGPIGDLTESKLKRAANVKDASNILPGHGGFFDRFDALILASPAFYLYIYVLKITGYAAI